MTKYNELLSYNEIYYQYNGIRVDIPLVTTTSGYIEFQDPGPGANLVFALIDKYAEAINSFELIDISPQGSGFTNMILQHAGSRAETRNNMMDYHPISQATIEISVR